MNYHVQTVPLVAANEDMVTVGRWLKTDGSFVNKGEIICDLESSKSVVDVATEYSGYLFILAAEGNVLGLDAPLAIISDENNDEVKRQVFVDAKEKLAEKGDSTRRKWTKKAEITAKRHGINIEDVPATGLIQEADVFLFIDRMKQQSAIGDMVYDIYPDTARERVLVLGGGVGAVQLIDAMVRDDRQRAVAVLDDNPAIHGKKVAGVEILGAISMLDELADKSIFDRLIISFSNNIERRAAVFDELLSRGFQFTNVIDRTVRLHMNIKMGTGNIILSNCSIGPCTSIGNNNFISQYVNLDHHNILGDNCTFGPGVMTSGEVHIESRTRFGTGIFIEPGIRIGAGSIVSSGAVITMDIPERSIVKKQIDFKIVNMTHNYL